VKEGLSRYHSSATLTELVYFENVLLQAARELKNEKYGFTDEVDDTPFIRENPNKVNEVEANKVCDML
jgi:hypothetical protein